MNFSGYQATSAPGDEPLDGHQQQLPPAQQIQIDELAYQMFEVEALPADNVARDELVRRWGYRDLVQFERVRYSFLKHWGTPMGPTLRHFLWDNSRAQPAMLRARERKEREKMNAHVAANADLVAPVEGVSLDDYARACLGAASGNFAAVLGELGMDMAKYERVAAGWNAKMAGDATGTVARLYGEAFTRVR
jgi:hypothetical protein